MDCELIHIELVPYHFGGIDDEARTRVEAHLLACPACLKDFLALKRSIEAREARPTAMAKARLRKAVMREIGHDDAGVSWSWWERPLAVAFAGAAMLAAIMLVHGVESTPGEAPHSLEAPR